MKYLLSVIALVFAMGVAHAEAETKKVCNTDAKTKKEVCKTIKVHKKAEKVTTGDPSAPEAKPAKKKK